MVPFSSRAKAIINSVLARTNLRLETLTRARADEQEFRQLALRGHFDRPVFPVPNSFHEMRAEPVFGLLKTYEREIARFAIPRHDSGFSFDNLYFSSPDAEVLYAMIRHTRPTTIVEVGSGYSTKLIRHAIDDAAISTSLICVDPSPRVEIAALASRVERRPIQEMDPHEIVELLSRDGLLFIDSSHLVRSGGDVPFLYSNVVPFLPPGTLVHVHDIFLPYEYPRHWVELGWGWAEQYLVQGFLALGDHFDVLWAGHYLQRTVPGFSSHFPNLTKGVASSLWLRVRNA